MKGVFSYERLFVLEFSRDDWFYLVGVNGGEFVFGDHFSHMCYEGIDIHIVIVRFGLFVEQPLILVPVPYFFGDVE